MMELTAKITDISEVEGTTAMIDVTIQVTNGDEVSVQTLRYGGVNDDTKNQIQADIKDKLEDIKAKAKFRDRLIDLQDMVGKEISADSSSATIPEGE